MGQTLDDMLAGRPYNGGDPELTVLKEQAAARLAAVHATPNTPCPERIAAIAPLIAPGSGPAIILSPFTMQYGFTVRLAPWVFINHGATFLDSAPITIGTRTAIGPNVQFITDTHPINPDERIIEGDPQAVPPFRVTNMAYPITIGERVWIGAGAILIGPVTIGDGAMVAAGSVVTRDVPPRMLVAGNPAREIRPVGAK